MFLSAFVFAQRKLADLRDNCKGVTAMEYGIIAAVTVVVVGGSAATLKTPLTTIWSSVSGALTTAAT